MTGRREDVDKNEEVADRTEFFRRRGENGWGARALEAQPVDDASGLVKTRGKADKHLVSLVAPTSFAAERYLTLRYVLELERKNRGRQVTAVTSPMVGDGKTTTTVNLALALTQSPGTRVLVVDADLRRPAVAKRLGIGGSQVPGLVEAIVDDRPLEDLVRPGPLPNLWLLAAGRETTTPYEVLRSPSLEAVIDQARRLYDHVVLDTPPIVIVSDCRLIETCVDGFLVVVAAHRTPRRLVEEALATVSPSKVIGLVFNGDNSLRSSYSRGYYHNHYAGRRPSAGGRASGMARLWGWLSPGRRRR